MRVFLMILAIVILAIGCQKEQPAVPVQLPPVEAQPEQTVAEPNVTKPLPAQFLQLVDKVKSLDSFSYNYRSPDNKLERQFFVKGSLIKIVLPQMNIEEQGKFYNTIYINASAKRAEAYCIGYSKCEGRTGKIKDLKYDETYIDTPVDWLSKAASAEEKGQGQIEGRNAIFFQTDKGKFEVEKFYGFLYRVEQEEKAWEFSDASFNSVKNEDVLPQ